MSLFKENCEIRLAGEMKSCSKNSSGSFFFWQDKFILISNFFSFSSFLVLSYLFVKTFYWRTDFDLNSATSERKRKRRNKLMNRFQRRRERKNRFETNKIGTILICFRSELISANKVLCKSQAHWLFFRGLWIRRKTRWATDSMFEWNVQCSRFESRAGCGGSDGHSSLDREQYSAVH